MHPLRLLPIHTVIAITASVSNPTSVNEAQSFIPFLHHALKQLDPLAQLPVLVRVRLPLLAAATAILDELFELSDFGLHLEEQWVWSGGGER